MRQQIGSDLVKTSSFFKTVSFGKARFLDKLFWSKLNTFDNVQTISLHRQLQISEKTPVSQVSEKMGLKRYATS